MVTSHLGLNRTFPIYKPDGTPFYDLVLNKAVYESVVMSLGDKITGDVYYRDNSLQVTMKEYIEFKTNPDDLYEEPIRFTLVNPPTIVREGMVKDNGDANGMTKYSFTFYHPMYQLGNFPFCDVAVSQDELRYLSEGKVFSWIGKPADFVAKLNKNLDGTQWKVEMSSRYPLIKVGMMSEVHSFDNATIADAIKWAYETWEVPYVIDTVAYDEEGYLDGKRFKVVFGLPSGEILDENDEPFVFRFGQGVGLKNNSRNPRNNKIVTRISGYGSEDNVPYGYPQIVWDGDEDDERLQYPLYDGIVGGQYVKLIKHPFTRTHLMPSIYRETVDRKVNPNNPDYDPDTILIDYYDAVSSEQYSFPNEINLQAPSYESHEFDVKPEFNDGQRNVTILGATPINGDTTDADSWVDDMDDDGNYLQSYFKLTLPALGFDLYACAAITQEMQINMRSGACLGCTFPVEVDWEAYKSSFYDEDGNFAPDGEQRNMTMFPDSTYESIRVIVKKENTTFGTLMPNIYQKPKSGDEIVFLGISLPVEYITSAEERLDDEMMSYMLENNVYYYDYPLKFDEHFLALNPNILLQIKPNVIVRFEFYDETLELYVKQLTIKYGQAPLPQYDITLTDNIEVVLNQIGQVEDDVEKLGSLLSLIRQESGRNIIVELAKKLSRVSNDTAEGLITFLRGLVSKDKIKAEKGLQIGTSFIGGMKGGRIDKDANAELESLTLRRFLEVPELRYNRISIQVGNNWRAPGGGIILQVDPDQDGEGGYLNTGTITLHLEDGEIGKIATDDLCMGIYHDEMTLNNDSVDWDDSKGNFKFSGFFTTYFKVGQIIETGHNSVFRYTLRNDERYPATHHPRAMMHFVCYGNSSNPARQSSRYSTLTYERYLYNVNTWEFDEKNIGAQFGDLSNLDAFDLDMEGYSAYLKNIYFTGRIEQIRELVDELATYTVDFSDYVDVVTVDDVGNVIGGLYRIDENENPYDFRIHSAISVRKNSELLVCCGDNETVTTGKYKIYAEPIGCTCALHNSTIYITSITNVKDGIAGSVDDDDFNYTAMRNTNNCSVNLTIDCEGETTIVKQFPVTIKHMSEPFVGADISNDASGVSWNTKTNAYIGLPITFDFTMWHNNEVLDITKTTDISLTTSTTGVTLSNSTAPATPAGHTIYYTKSIQSITKYAGTANEVTYKVARIQITAMGKDVPLVTNIDITCTAQYAGVNYERTLTHTINKSTDANVYSLMPSDDEVVASGAGSQKTLSTNKVSCTIWCDSSDDKHYTVPVADYTKHRLALYYKITYQDGTVGTETAYNTSGDGVSIDTSVKLVDFYIYGLNAQGNVDKNVMHDHEDVYVIANGVDGAGAEYVFWRQATWNGNDSDKPTLVDDHSTANFQHDNHTPQGCSNGGSTATGTWTDEPSGVTSNYKYEFYAQRKKVGGVWQAFGDVLLWNQYVIDGSTPYVSDLSNENSLVNCNDDGTIPSGTTYEPTTFSIYKGGSLAMSEFNVAIVATNISYTSTTNANGTITITPSGTFAQNETNATIVVTATHKTNSSIVLSETYSINKLFAGDSTVIYSLQPSLSVIHAEPNGTTMIDQALVVWVKKSVGGVTTMLDTIAKIQNEGLHLFYTQGDSGTATDFTQSANGISTAAICGSAGSTVIYLKDGATYSTANLLDRERIPVVSDGDPFEYEDFTPEQLEALKGERGLTGCISRVYETYTHDSNFYYRNDTNTASVTGIRYLDFMAVADNTTQSGYRVYMCKTTHPATASTFDNDIANWEEVSQNVASAFFTYLIAKNAHFKFGSGNQFVIQDSNGNTVAGLTGAIPDANHEDASVRIWAGGSNPYLAPFRVLQDGQMFADKAHIKGLVEIKNANEGVMVYDSNDNLRVQIVAGEVAEPVNESITVSRAKTSNYSLVNGNFSLTPTPISMSLGTLKAGAMAYPSVGFNVTTNGGRQVMKITNNNGIEERFVVTVSLVTSNGVVVGSTSSTFTSSSSSGTDIEDFGVGLRGLLVPTTAPYYLYVSASIENVNTGNTGAGTFGSLSANASVTTNINGGCLHKTPVGTRIGTNGMFVNLGNNKAFNITADKTEIRYSNYRLRIDSQGLYASSDGINYYPFVKQTKILNDSDFTNNTYEVKPDDGVLFLNNSNAVTLTLTSNSSDEVKIVSKTGTTYALGGSPVYRCNGDAAQTFGVNDKKARMFVKDTLGNYYEFYCCN